MIREFKVIGAAAACMFALAANLQAAVTNPTSAAHSYYLDCSHADGNGDGSSRQSPWSTLEQLNAHTFDSGDTIALKRGATCNGVLEPKGSGREDAPIRLTAYGEGARPRVVAGKAATQSLRLFDQQYWDIDSLDLSGGTIYGVFVSGTKGVLHHIHLSNLAIHDVMGDKLKSKDTGLLVLATGSVEQHFEDVVIDGVNAWHTNQWSGIMVGGGNVGMPPETAWNVNAIIRNSTVHDVQGDGIILFRVHHGSIESSVAWNTGMQITETNGTPNAIWTWMCDDCTVKGSEAYLTDSPGVDGGSFDIDYDNSNNAVVDSYGHDTQGYCVSVFGAGYITTHSTVRGNLCINNGRSPRMADYQGAIFLLTWNGGSIDGLTIEDNTVFWNPVENAPALLNDADIKPETGAFRNNAIYSTSPWLVDNHTSLLLSGNHYVYFGAGAPLWRSGGASFSTLAALQHADLESGGSFAQNGIDRWPEVFAQAGSKPQAHAEATAGKFLLVTNVPATLGPDGLLNDDALQQINMLKSFSDQYHPRGLDVTLRFTAGSIQSFQSEAFRNAVGDLELHNIKVEQVVGPEQVASTLYSANHSAVEHWQGLAGPVKLGLAMHHFLGDPSFAQRMRDHE